MGKNMKFHLSTASVLPNKVSQNLKLTTFVWINTLFVRMIVVCRILHEQVIAVLGPQNPFSSDNVQSICASLAIPHIEARWDYRAWPPNVSLSINVYPDYRALSKAFSDIVKLWRWNSLTILYETNEGKKDITFLLSALRMANLELQSKLVRKSGPQARWCFSFDSWRRYSACMRACYNERRFSRNAELVILFNQGMLRKLKGRGEE